MVGIEPEKREISFRKLVILIQPLHANDVGDCRNPLAPYFGLNLSQVGQQKLLLGGVVPRDLDLA